MMNDCSAKSRSPVWCCVFAAAMLAVAGCVNTVVAPPATWETRILADHPLVGRIWSVAGQRFVSPAAVADALGDADFILLGEKHDNPDHHRLQAWAIGATAERGRRPAIVFEMVDPTQETALRDFLKANPGDADGIGAAIGWAERGWPDWAIYRPVAAAALDSGAPILAGAVERDKIRRVGREGFDALGDGVARELGLDTAAPAWMRAEMKSEIADSHCGYLPEAALAPMADVQRAKDAIMADALLRAIALDGRDTAILITGASHARGDRGAPWHLRRMAPASVAVAIGFTEVQPGETAAGAYERAEGGPRAFDFLWFTPRVDNDDPCEVFAEQLRRMGEQRNQAKPSGGG